MVIGLEAEYQRVLPALVTPFDPLWEGFFYVIVQNDLQKILKKGAEKIRKTIYTPIKWLLNEGIEGWGRRPSPRAAQNAAFPLS